MALVQLFEEMLMVGTGLLANITVSAGVDSLDSIVGHTDNAIANVGIGVAEYYLYLMAAPALFNLLFFLFVFSAHQTLISTLSLTPIFLSRPLQRMHSFKRELY